MKKKLLLFIFLLFIVKSFAQTDSLTKELKAAKTASQKVEILTNLGMEYARKGNFEKAISHFSTAATLAKSKKNSSLEASLYNEIGNVEADLGNNSSAINYYQKALKIIPDTALTLKGIIHKNIGAVFLSWKNLPEALKFYDLGLQFAQQAGDNRTIADCFNNKGTVYEQQNQYKKAAYNYNKALDFYLKERIYDRISLTYNNLAILAKVQNQLLQAAKYYQKAVDNAEIANNKWLTAAISNNLGNLLSEMKEYQKSDYSLKNALALEKEIDAKELIHETLENLADNEKRRGNHQLAFSYLKQASEAKSNFINLENTKEVAKLKEEFDVTNKEKRIELLHKESKIQQLTLTKKNNTILTLSGLFIGIVLISFLVFRSYRLKQEARLKLATAETKNKIQEEKLRISRELHDNIGAQLSFINGSIQGLATNYQDNEQLQQTQQVMQNTIKELRSTVWLINQQEFSLEEFVIKIREYIKPFHLGKPQINVVNETDNDYKLQPIIATNLFRVIQEVVNNSLKHSESTLLEVKIYANQNLLNLQVSDNGKGYDVLSKSGGYGLKNIEARIATLKGSYQVNSTPLKGTIVNITVPI